MPAAVADCPHRSAHYRAVLGHPGQQDGDVNMGLKRTDAEQLGAKTRHFSQVELGSDLGVISLRSHRVPTLSHHCLPIRTQLRRGYLVHLGWGVASYVVQRNQYVKLFHGALLARNAIIGSSFADNDRSSFLKIPIGKSALLWALGRHRDAGHAPRASSTRRSMRRPAAAPTAGPRPTPNPGDNPSATRFG
jgi:hypothetical protein